MMIVVVTLAVVMELVLMEVDDLVVVCIVEVVMWRLMLMLN